MKKITFPPKVQERPPYLTHILKISEHARVDQPPTILGKNLACVFLLKA